MSMTTGLVAISIMVAGVSHGNAPTTTRTHVSADAKQLARVEALIKDPQRSITNVNRFVAKRGGGGGPGTMAGIKVVRLSSITGNDPAARAKIANLALTHQAQLQTLKTALVKAKLDSKDVLAVDTTSGGGIEIITK